MGGSVDGGGGGGGVRSHPNGKRKGGCRLRRRRRRCHRGYTPLDPPTLYFIPIRSYGPLGPTENSPLSFSLFALFPATFPPLSYFILYLLMYTRDSDICICVNS